MFQRQHFAKAMTKPMYHLVRVGLCACLLTGFAHAQVKPEGNALPHLSIKQQLGLKGQWLIDLDGKSMIDPQTSGLKYLNGHLYSLSDGSAHASQIRRLHQIDAGTGQVLQKFGETRFSEEVRNSCFYDYLSDRPDYEALVPLPNPLSVTNTQDENGSAKKRLADTQGAQSWIFVTEDATRSKPLSEACQARYKNTHSTDYPTLLVKIEQQGDDFNVTGVRPIQFPASAMVGNFANDGIEGLALSKTGTLYLGLEKDAQVQARVFSIDIDEGFWQGFEFAQVVDAKLHLPRFEKGNHPINGMDIYYPDEQSEGFLVAAARNTNQLWIVDLSRKLPSKVIDLVFLAPSIITDDQSNSNNGAYCAPWHQMHNASIEGVAVQGNTFWLVNDPWKVNYAKNIVCEADRERYERFSPLLFQAQFQPEWFISAF